MYRELRGAFFSTPISELQNSAVRNDDDYYSEIEVDKHKPL